MQTPPVNPVAAPLEISLQRLLTLVLAVVLLAVGLDFFGANTVRVFRPPADKTSDFIQEWLSAKNYFAGHPIYEPQRDSGSRYLPGFTEPTLKYNAHPPGSVLLALPFARWGYSDAHFAWNLATTPLFLFVVLLAMRELCSPFRVWHLLPLATVLIWAEPVRMNIAYGQLNFVLVFLLTLGWLCDRRGLQVASGVFVGLAAGVKLFPALVLVYFVFSGRWRAVLAGVFAAVAVNGLAAAVFGVNAFEDYVREVMPSLRMWVRAWHNVSVAGLVSRLVSPPTAHGLTVDEQPLIQTVSGGISVAVFAVAVAWAGIRAKKHHDADLGWAVAVAALPLASPIAWQHSFCTHVVPLAILAARLTGVLRYVGWFATGGILLWGSVYLFLFVSKAHRPQPGAGFTNFLPLTPLENLLGSGLPTIFALVLLGLTLTLRPSSSPAGAPSQTL